MITDPARLLPAAPQQYLLKPKYDYFIKCAGHLYRALTPDECRETIEHLIRVLSPLDFDAIACRGLSGLLIAPIVAYRLQKSLLVIRKDREDCHSSRRIEGDVNAKRYIILDDFISSGETLRAILRAITHEMPQAKCVGVMEYQYVDERSTYREVRTVPETYAHHWLNVDGFVSKEERALAGGRFRDCYIF